MMDFEIKIFSITAGAPLEGVRGVRLHPWEFDSGCGAPLLRMATTICESTFFYKKQLLQTNKTPNVYLD